MEDPFCYIAGIDLKKSLNMLRKEIFRKSIHICTAFVPLLLNAAYWPVLSGLVLCIIVYTIAELCRQRGIHVPVISAVTAAAARKRDENHFVLGPLTLAAGVIAAALLFPSGPAAIGIYALAFGDGLASLAGKLLGSVHIPGTAGKTVMGSLTCFISIFISAYIVCGEAAAALIIAVCGMVIEVLPLRDFDNLLIPVLLAAIAVLCGVT